MKVNKRQFKGFVEAEVLLAAALLSMFVVAITGALYYAQQSAVLYGGRTQAVRLLDEQVESVRNIRDGGWNELIYSQTAVEVDSGKLIFSGEGTDEIIGKYTRTSTFDDVCRDASDVIATCPGDYIDLETKLVTSEISYTTFLGVPQVLTREMYLTNWEGIDWVQTDWSGGSGQSIWSDTSKYDSDDGKIETGTVGQVTLLETGGGACGSKTWDFTTDSNYTYDSLEIEVTGGNAQFISSAGVGYNSITTIDSFEYDTSEGEYPDMIHISGNIYAVASRGSGNDGWITTIEIDDLGIITTPVVDALEFDTSEASYPEIIHISGDVYAIVYQGARSDGWISTVSIDSAGSMSNIDSFEYETSDDRAPSIVHVDGDVYAIAYSGSSSDGYISTIDIDANGTINSLIDTYEFNTSYAINLNLIHVISDIYSVANRGASNDGFIQTIEIDSSGSITHSIVDSLEFDTSEADTPVQILVDVDTVAVFYEGPGSDGWVATYDIDGSGLIVLVDFFEYNSTNGEYPSVVSLSSNNFAVTYNGSSDDGFIDVMNISDSGTIGSVDASYEFDVAETIGSSVLRLNGGDYLAIAYEGTGSDGYITTVKLDSSASYFNGVSDIYPVTTFSSSSLDQWSSFIESTTKNGGEIYYQLSDNGTSWYYWDGASWSSAGASNYNIANVVNANIGDFPITSGEILFKAFLEGDGTQQVQLDSVSIGCANLQMEVGDVDVDENWVTVTMSNTYSSPVVVMSYFESNNTLPASVRIRNVAENSFDIRVHNPADVNLSTDTITYWIVEQGKWILDGISFEARSQEVSTVAYKNNWIGEQVDFKNAYSSAPIVFHQVASENDADWITSFVSRIGDRGNPPTVSGFDLALNASEVTSSYLHASETIGWIAIDTTANGAWSGSTVETLTTPDSIRGHDNGCYTYPYANLYSSVPHALVTQLQMDGGDGGWGVMCSNTLTDAGMHAEEDQESDSERSHTTEIFGVIAFDSLFSIGSSGGGGSGSFETETIFISSAFDIGDAGAIQIIEWDEDIASCGVNCDIVFEVRSAPDSGGSPGIWTDWYGDTGSGSVFIDPNGTIISKDLNDNRWIQYRATLTGDGNDTPILEEVRINYR